LNIAFESISRGKTASDFGIGRFKLLGLGEIGNNLGDNLRLSGGNTLVNATTLIITTIIIGEFFDGFGGGDNRLIESIDTLVLTGLSEKLL
jgi:hypothetical protein